MKQNIWKKKLRSERGETIGEALAAMLVVALGALMLAAMTSAATRIVTQSETAYAQYLRQRNVIESGGKEKKNLEDTSSQIQPLTTGYIIFSSENDATVKLKGTNRKEVTYRVVTNSDGKNILVTYPVEKP